MADPLKTLRITGSRGLILKGDMADMPPDAMVDAWNICLTDPPKTISARRGTLRYSATKATGDMPMGNTSYDHTARIVRLFWWQTRDGTDLLIAIAKTAADAYAAELYWNVPATNKTFAKATGGPFNIGNNHPSIAILNDRLFVATGHTDATSNVVARWVSATPAVVIDKTAGLSAPTTKPTTANSGNAGVVTAGDHLYVYTFYDRTTDAESLPSPVSDPALTAPGNEGVTISNADALPGDADRYRLYRTLAGGTEYRLVVEVAVLNAADVDNVKDENLGYDTAPEAGGVPFTCKFNLAHKHRMLWANKTDTTGTVEPNLVYVSEPGKPVSVDPLNAVAVRRDDGDEITALASLYEQVFVFKRRHVYQLIYDAELLYRAEPMQIGEAVGTICPGTITPINECLFYLTDRGIIRTCGRHSEMLAELINLESTEAKFAADINWAKADEFFAVNYWPKNEYWLFVASNDSSYVDTVLVFDYQDGTLTRHTTFASAACMTEPIVLGTDTRPQAYPMYGDYDGVVWQGADTTKSERDLDIADGYHTGTGTVAGAGPWTVTDTDAAFPTAGALTTGLRGTQVTLVDSDGFCYTGIITSNNATALTITNWLLGRTPTAGDYTYYTETMESTFTTAWFDFGDMEHIQQVKHILLVLAEKDADFTVELRTADNPGGLNATAWATWARTSATLGDDVGPFARIPLGGRGRYASLRISSTSATKRWVIRSFALKFLMTGARA